jgi:hypothetical protein
MENAGTGIKTRHEATTATGANMVADYISDGNGHYYQQPLVIDGGVVPFDEQPTNFYIKSLGDNNKALFISWIAVPKACQREKVGAAMVENLELFASQNQCQKVEGSAKDSGAKIFFQKMGYHFPDDGMKFEKIL